MGLLDIFFGRKKSLKQINKDLSSYTTRLERVSKSMTEQLEILNQQPLNQLPERIKDAVKILGNDEDKLIKTERSILELRKIENGGEEFDNQIRDITLNLGSLNAVIEMKLQDANDALKKVYKFYNDSIDPLSEIHLLAKQLPSLNNDLSSLRKKITEIDFQTVEE